MLRFKRHESIWNALLLENNKQGHGSGITLLCHWSFFQCIILARDIGVLDSHVLFPVISVQSLNLTGNVWGDPQPEVSWLKNDNELVPDDHIKLKFEHGKFASITIAAVSSADSGKYALMVKNKYGTEAGQFTVSVYIPEDGTEKKD